MIGKLVAITMQTGKLLGFIVDINISTVECVYIIQPLTRLSHELRGP